MSSDAPDVCAGGGSVFPNEQFGAVGITLRDYFAAHAPACPLLNTDDICEWRYRYADVMLRKRKA